MQEIPVQRGDNLVLWEIILYFERRKQAIYLLVLKERKIGSELKGKSSFEFSKVVCKMSRNTYSIA